MTHPDDREIDLQLFGELVQGLRGFYQLEKRYFKKDRTLIWGRLTVVLLRDSGGKPCFAIALVETSLRVNRHPNSNLGSERRTRSSARLCS